MARAQIEELRKQLQESEERLARERESHEEAKRTLKELSYVEEEEGQTYYLIEWKRLNAFEYVLVEDRDKLVLQAVYIRFAYNFNEEED